MPKSSGSGSQGQEREMTDKEGHSATIPSAEAFERYTKPMEGAAGAMGALEVTDVGGFVAALKTYLDPIFDEQRETWDHEGLAAMVAFEATGAKLDGIGGNCPVQAEGWVDGSRFYFRARGESWQFHVAKDEAAIYTADEMFYIDRDYGEGPYDAGWMPRHEALGFIVQAIAEFRARWRSHAPGCYRGQPAMTDLDPKANEEAMRYAERAIHAARRAGIARREEQDRIASLIEVQLYSAKGKETIDCLVSLARDILDPLKVRP